MRVNINSTVPIKQMQRLLELEKKFKLKRSQIVEIALEEFLENKFNHNGSVKKEVKL